MNKIRGNVVGTPMKRPDFNQTDPKKSDYILNNPLPIITKEDEGKILIVKDGKLVAIRNSFVEGEGLSIKTVNGGKLKFFVGTEEEYKALPDEEKENLFALFTDDTSQAEFDTLKDSAMTLYGGTPITSGDLNDYIIEGNYTVESNAFAHNISNIPVKRAGQLKVLSGVGHKNVDDRYSYIIQVYIALECLIYTRFMHKSPDGIAWSGWEQFAGTGSHATHADYLSGKSYNDFRGHTEFTYPSINGIQSDGSVKHVNDFFREFHGFVFNVAGLPEGYHYGFLDTDETHGDGFSPSNARGMCKQTFRSWQNNDIFVRRYVDQSADPLVIPGWSAWQRLAMSNADGTLSATTATRLEQTPIFDDYISGNGCYIDLQLGSLYAIADTTSGQTYMMYITIGISESSISRTQDGLLYFSYNSTSKLLNYSERETDGMPYTHSNNIKIYEIFKGK